MAISVKSLNHLQKQQYLNNQLQKQLLGDGIGIIYIWTIEIVISMFLRKKDIYVPQGVAFFVMICCILSDLIIKLILQRDNTVMDSFLKSRPISYEVWRRFLILSQLWKPSNLMMPLLLAPACFIIFPFFKGFLIFICLYLASVFSGCFVMLIKHKGVYQSEIEVKSFFANRIKSAKGYYISALPLRSFLRSRRLRTTMIFAGIFIYIQIIFPGNTNYGILFPFLFIFLTSCAIPQYGFAIEANFFNGIWTRPIAIERLFSHMYRFGMLTAAIGFLLCLPVCLWSEISICDLISISLFVAFCGNLPMLLASYNCVPYDLFGRTFYSHQEVSSTFGLGTIIAILLIIGIGMASVYFLPGRISRLLLSSLGIIGLCLHKSYFRWVARRFKSNRYKFMLKYTSKC